MDLNAITEVLITKSFPELQDRSFRASILNNLPDSSIAIALLWENGDFSILADKFLVTYSEQAIQQTIAHELAHIVRGVSRWSITQKLVELLYSHSRLYRCYEERKTCELAESRGYETPEI